MPFFTFVDDINNEHEEEHMERTTPTMVTLSNGAQRVHFISEPGAWWRTQIVDGVPAHMADYPNERRLHSIIATLCEKGWSVTDRTPLL